MRSEAVVADARGVAGGGGGGGGLMVTGLVRRSMLRGARVSRACVPEVPVRIAVGMVGSTVRLIFFFGRISPSSDPAEYCDEDIVSMQVNRQTGDVQ